MLKCMCFPDLTQASLKKLLHLPGASTLTHSMPGGVMQVVEFVKSEDYARFTRIVFRHGAHRAHPAPADGARLSWRPAWGS